MFGNQNAVLAGGDIGVAADLLHHVLHESRFLTRRQILLYRIGRRNRRADDVELIFGLFDVIAVGIIAHQLLVKLRSLVRLL